MSEPSAEKKEIPAASAPSLGELFELSLTALVDAPGVFSRLSERPAPGPGAALLAALAWGGAFFALNLTRVALAHPAALQAYEPWKIAAVFAAALGVWAALYLLASSLVYGLGRSLGSAGDFDRALLVAAIALAASPAHALCAWIPPAMPVPTLVAAWIAACGLAALFKANAWAARGACAALAAGVLALQYGAGLLADKYAGPARLAASAAQSAPSPDQLVDLQRQMEQVQALAVEAQQNVSNAQSGQSSLDLLRGPAAEDAPPAGPTERQQLAQMSASGDAMNKSVLGMLDSIAPMLDNPAITQNMSLQQKSDYAELKKLITGLKTGMSANTITSPQEQQAQMMRIQQLVMRVMSAGIPMPKANPPPGEPPKADSKR